MKNKFFLIFALIVLVVTFFVFSAFSPPTVYADTIYWNQTFRFSFPVNIGIDSGLELRVLFMDADGIIESFTLEDMVLIQLDGRYIYESVIDSPEFFVGSEFFVYILVEYSPQYNLPYFGVSRVFAEGLRNGSRVPVFGSRYTNGFVFDTEQMDDFAFVQFDFDRLESSQQIADLLDEINSLEQEREELNDKLAQALEDLADYGVVDQSLNFVEKAFRSVGNIFKIEFLPGIKIGTFFVVPLILGVVFLILRLVRGE